MCTLFFFFFSSRCFSLAQPLSNVRSVRFCAAGLIKNEVRQNSEDNSSDTSRNRLLKEPAAQCWSSKTKDGVLLTLIESCTRGNNRGTLKATGVERSLGCTRSICALICLVPCCWLSTRFDYRFRSHCVGLFPSSPTQEENIRFFFQRTSLRALSLAIDGVYLVEGLTDDKGVEYSKDMVQDEIIAKRGRRRFGRRWQRR